MSTDQIKYFVFDIETVADGALVSKLRYPTDNLQPTEAVDKYRAELMEKYSSDFIPYTFQLPISIAIAKVAADFRLVDLVALDEPEFRPHIITEHFWRGWQRYQHPTFVSFNGRTFDLPVMELAAFRYGLSLPDWFREKSRSFEQPRNRYNTFSHLDLQDTLTNFGATRFTGGLNLATNILGKPGKMDVQGDMVQDMYNQGRGEEINNYCRCDVLDTYFVFLRTRVMVGDLDLKTEQKLIEETHQWLTTHADDCQAWQLYLDRWGDWQNPWVED